ncbi:hypothetical protein ACFWR9_17085 [Streptomyces sp. NPDC058534]|uniref:hypothetical protein n=1 Tax=Streptomyces sp. NPDC058534 TaxID=3346541 RepID=UPI003659F75B
MDHLEQGFAGRLDNERYQEEVNPGVLCSLGEDWQMVNVLLTCDEDFPPTGAECLPVLGGEHVAPLGEHVDLLLESPERVRAAYEFLDGVDDQDLLRRHRSQLDGRVVGTAPDWMVEGLLGRMAYFAGSTRGPPPRTRSVAKQVYA